MPTRRASTGKAANRKPTPRKTRGGYPAGGRTVGELPPPPASVSVTHPGVLAAGGQVTEEECPHPPGRRDGKNKRLCRACGGPVPDGVK